jgi:uncharacterized protein YdhG (YjbR/CyaY superfamily)
MKGIQASDVDEYIAQVPDDQRRTLAILRDIIRSIAPDAVESISYGLPAYKLNGKPLVYFGTARTHYALYAISGAIRDKFRNDLAGYSISKGTIRFPFDKPFPAALIKKLVVAQLAERRGA